MLFSIQLSVIPAWKKKMCRRKYFESFQYSEEYSSIYSHRSVGFLRNSTCESVFLCEGLETVPKCYSKKSESIKLLLLNVDR